MRCEEVREALPAYVNTDGIELRVQRHLSRCPECKAEFARYEALMGGLRTLQTVTAEPPAGLFGALVDIPARASRLHGARARVETARDHVTRNRNAYLSGGVAVALAGAVGAALWRSRARRVATA
jgi:anti-sigma factor RsiW